jgi:hypothetical protein
MTPAEVPLINAEILFRQPGPALSIRIISTGSIEGRPVFE